MSAFVCSRRLIVATLKASLAPKESEFMRSVWLLAATACLLQQIEPQKQTKEHPGVLKKYSYASDRFTISSPQIPKLTNLKDYTEYGVYWNEGADVVINLSVKRGLIDCSAWNGWAKSLKGNVIRIIAVGGSPALESRGNRNALQAGYQLDQCIDGRLYSFESGWPRDDPKPPIIDEVPSSFHVIQKTTN
jgi:hypothetical protein